MQQHQKGLLIALAGAVALSPDTMMIRLIGADVSSMLFWRGALLFLVLFTFLSWRMGVVQLLRLCRATGWLGVASGTINARRHCLLCLRRQNHQRRQSTDHRRHRADVGCRVLASDLARAGKPRHRACHARLLAGNCHSLLPRRRLPGWGYGANSRVSPPPWVSDLT